jgi:hypothetical protein
MLTAFAYATTSTLHAMQIARLNQQAADLVTQRVEEMRDVPFGALAHDPGGVAGDPHLTSCSGSRCYVGEPLVEAAGGVLNPQITTVTVNSATYTLYTYVTSPTSEVGEENRRVTVIAQWSAYNREWEKTASSIITQTQRGLPLPEFKLTQVGPSTVTVNPGVTAAFGFQLSNQGAPDQWNISADLVGYSIVLDDGDDVYNPATDTQPMTDHNGDGIVDSGRLEPKESLVFWLLQPVAADSSDSTTQFGTTAQAVSQEGVGTATVESVLVVTTSVISATPTPSPTTSVTPSVNPTGTPTPSPSQSPGTCAAANPAPTPAAVSGYSRKAYVLHNSGSTSWPTFPLPSSGDIPGSTAMSPMYLDMNGVSIPSDRDLPSYSINLLPSGTPGRLLYNAGGASVEFQTQNPNRDYSGTMVLRMWVRPVVSGQSVKLNAQVYKRRSNGNTTMLGDTSELSIDPFTCDGFQEIWFSFSLGNWSTGNKTVLGVRLQNTGDGTVALAYDHGSFPATFTVVER